MKNNSALAGHYNKMPLNLHEIRKMKKPGIKCWRKCARKVTHIVPVGYKLVQPCRRVALSYKMKTSIPQGQAVFLLDIQCS